MTKIETRMLLHCLLAAAASMTGEAAHAFDVVDDGSVSWYRTEWRANTFAESRQSEAAIALDADDAMFVVWSSRRQQGGRYGVYGQRFTHEGEPVGQEVALSVWGDAHQRSPSVARLGAGNGDAWWTAWQTSGGDGDLGAIAARRFGDDREVPVNLDGLGHQLDPVVVAGPGGGGFVVWTTEEDGQPARIRGRLIDSAKGPGMFVEIGTNTCRPLCTPSAAFAADGSFAVAYAVEDALAATRTIEVQRFDARGAAVAAPIVVSAIDRGGLDQIEPAIAAVAEGFVVVWLERRAPGDPAYGVVMRRLSADAAPMTEVRSVASSPRRQSAAAIAPAPDGGVVIGFNGHDADGTDVFARRFDAEGSARGAAFRINAHELGAQGMAPATGRTHLVCGRGGAIICVWSGDGGLGDASGVYVTRLAPDPPTSTPGLTAAARPATAGADRAGADAAPHAPPSFDPARRNRRRAAAAARAPGDGSDFGFIGIFDTGWDPPDPHLAVGEAHGALVTNGGVAFFDKSDGSITFDEVLEGSDGFFGPVGASTFVFDPEVIYDPMSRRFFLMASDRELATARSYILLAVSDDANPNGDWFRYRFDTTAMSGPIFDSPNIAVDDEVVYVTGDRGGGGPPTYAVYTFDKASLLVGDPPALTRSTLLATSTESAGIPPVSFDDPPALYMVEHREGPSSSLRLIALQDPLGTPTFVETSVSVSPYGAPESAPQEGTAVAITTFDARFWSAAYRDGSLWATHHINSARVIVRWYEVAMNGWPDSGAQPELVQFGMITPPNDGRAFFSAIAPDAFGNAAIVYARSSPTDFVSIETAFRYKSDLPNKLRPAITRKTNTGPWTTGRWGDYSRIQVDPVDGKTFWTHHEYAVGSSWRTWVHRFTPDFAGGDITCNGVVDFEDLLPVLASWGQCPEGGAVGDPCPADTDDSGIVDIVDLLRVLADWS